MANITKEALIAFEKKISETYCAGKIRAPIHLSDGNEDQLIEIFKNIKPTDWVFSSWRSHYHALLHGIDPDALELDINAGRSITLAYPDHKFYTSAIVGGIIPIALGVALGNKRSGSTDHVYCMIGDMTSETGGAYEAIKYAFNFELPITFVIEDNTQSVGTPTYTVWGSEDNGCFWKNIPCPNVKYYSYTKTWPHVGAGKRVTF